METEPEPLEHNLADAAAPEALPAAAAPEPLGAEDVVAASSVIVPPVEAAAAEQIEPTSVPSPLPVDEAPALHPVTGGAPDMVGASAPTSDGEQLAAEAKEGATFLATPVPAEPLLPTGEQAAPVQLLPETDHGLPSLDELPPQSEDDREEREPAVPPVTPEPRG